MQTANSFQELYRQIAARKVPFFIVFFVAVFVSYTILYVIDLYPEPVTPTKEATQTATETVAETAAVDVRGDAVSVSVEPTAAVQMAEPAAALPVSITFDALDRTVEVLNPTSRSIADLDAALLEGVVRHPDSADFSDAGNIFILGHSSYLPNVMNKNFQAFNGIQKLKWGDLIRVASADAEYVYRVDRVYEAAASEIVVPTDVDKAKLTLATCNSFGSRDDRFMVEATLVETNLL